MTSYMASFDRIGRDHGIAPLAVTGTEDEIMEQLYRYARPHLGSRDLDVLVNFEERRGYVLAGVRNAGQFTLTPACADCEDALTVADLDGKRYCRVDAGHRMAAGEDVTYDQDPADGESPRTAADCRGSGIYDCPCGADAPDGLCSCCRSGECNGSCAVRPFAA